MAYRSTPANRRLPLLALVLAGAIAFAQWKGWWPKDAGKSAASGPVVRPPERPAGTAMPNSRKIGTWEEWQGCTLIEDRGNDGDSFRVRQAGTDHILRLYFADCPEKYRNQYNKDRISEQGRYFGGLTEEETLEVGESARDFSLGCLREAPFTVLTRSEQVFESGRYYAFVTTRQGDLAELLVGKGLARIHTKGDSRPRGASSAQAKQRLLAIERKARTAKVGGWAKR